MLVDLIDNLDDLDKIKSNWDEVYNLDPESNVFISYPFMRAWLKSTDFSWKVLTVRQQNSRNHVLFFPLAFNKKKRGIIKITEMLIGGNYMSDHTGFICLPEHLSRGVTAIVNYLTSNVKWDIFRLIDVFDRKVDFMESQFSSRKKNIVSKTQGQACPCILFPEKWEDYLQNHIGKNHRKKFTRFIKELNQNDQYRLDFADSNNFENYLKILFRFYQLRWPQVKIQQIDMMKHIFITCFEANILLMPVLFYNKTPIAVSTNFIDKKKSSFAAYISGWCPNHKDLSPGMRLRCLTIHYAFKNKFKYFDFLRGDEKYKQEGFGARLRYNKDFVIIRTSMKYRVYKFLDESKKYISSKIK